MSYYDDGNKFKNFDPELDMMIVIKHNLEKKLRKGNFNKFLLFFLERRKRENEKIMNRKTESFFYLKKNTHTQLNTDNW